MANLIQYKCPSCGGPISFDPGAQKLTCPFCENEYEVETLAGYGQELENSSAADEMEWAEPGTHFTDAESANMSVFSCKSCGGQVIGDTTTAATTCPYCGSPMVITGRLSGELKPDYVIPFKLDKDTAIKALKSHISGKKLLPKAFTDQNHIEEIKGVYVPFWLFDGTADANMLYRGTRTRMWQDPDYMYTETSYYSIERAGELDFERIPADASSKMADDLMDSLEPFDFSQAVPFDTAYLSGYLADRYDVKSADCTERINTRARATTEQVFRNTVSGYETVTLTNSSVRMTNSRILYTLYPVWLLTTKWNGQTYTFAMNGQTGKFVGDLPLDTGALWKWRAIIFAIAGAAAYALMYFMNV